MNNERRKEIAKASSLIEEAASIIEQVAADEQEYYDNMPESLQSGDKGDRAQSAIAALENAVSNLETALSDLEEASS